MSSQHQYGLLPCNLQGGVWVHHI
ncbi:TPA: DUF5431 family protein, partial [Klebsiella pneumoniae]|nr:DUF5431 family protein [Klebsiella pneumoniae]MBV7345177.1 FlmC family protein [Klebsiella pneumoniae]MBV7402844.1 FlmC family protein [Klebsiella pneumoniae]MBZ4049780.1 DUF5431 family protein [Klebsiella pneumoniae]MYM10767.1 hypothetical protein [Klebsiella pneumoniae]